MPDDVESAAASGDRLATLSVIAESLVAAIANVPDADVPPLAARLVDVLKRIGGRDPSVLLWMRDRLARTVDRLVDIQGLLDGDGKPIAEAKALAPTVHQLVTVVEAIASTPAQQPDVPEGVVTIDEAKRRRAARQSDAATRADSTKGGRKRRG